MTSATDSTTPDPTTTPAPARRHMLVGGAAAIAALGLAPSAHAGATASGTRSGTAQLAGAPKPPRMPRSRLHRWAADSPSALFTTRNSAWGTPI